MVLKAAGDLAPLDAATLVHSEAVLAHIRDEISAAPQACISFARFMELALYAPGLGYYSAGAEKLGAAGDFVTAPEISPLYSQCVAAQVREVLGHLDTAEILEVGAGSGVMAAQVLRRLDALGAPPRRYLILEPSPDLRQRQAATIERICPQSTHRVMWCDGLPERGFRGVVLANELLDALPACRFRVTGQGFTELSVGWDCDHLTWVEHNATGVTLTQTIEQLLLEIPQQLPVGYESELSLVRTAWVRDMTTRLSAGVLLLFDYGYPQSEFYHPQRIQGTLSCYHRHRMHSDPFLLPGLQDISTHVDFSAVAAGARRAGGTVVGFTTQANFLMASGLLDLLAEFDTGSARFLESAAQVKRLLLPGEMGDAVKVMAVARGFDGPLSGFSGRDFRAAL